MIKTIVSILVGIIFALATFMLVAIYWLFGLMARLFSLLLMPFRRLFSAR